MTQEQREMILAASYLDILANESVRRLLQDIVEAVNAVGAEPAGFAPMIDEAIEVRFGVKTIDLDSLPLEHARAAVNRAVRRMLSR